MGEHIEYFFWMNSDWALLGADRLERIAHECDLPIRYMPIDLTEVYRRTGGQLLQHRSIERQAYRVAELRRWCRLIGIEINPTPRHMCPDASAASLFVIAADRLRLPTAVLYRAILWAEWCEDRDISDKGELIRVATALGLDARSIQDEAERPAVLAVYKENTERAIASGVFGSPSYVYNGELFWGQDRLDMLRQAVDARIAQRAC